MAKVVLVRPPSIISAGSYIGSLTPPIGVAYIAAALRNNNHKVSIVDSVGLDPEKSTYLGNKLILRGITFEEILNLIPEDTDLIGFSGMFSSEWTSLRPLVNMIGNKFSDKFFVGGGEHFTAAPEFSLEQCKNLDAICLGEGEETLVEIANAIDSAGGLDESSFVNEISISRRDIDNKQIVTRNLQKNLSTAGNESIEPLDVITVKAFDRKIESVSIMGEVYFPGIYPIQPDDTILEVINRAGGLKPTASLKNSVFQRQSVRELDQMRIKKIQEDIRREILLLRN